MSSESIQCFETVIGGCFEVFELGFLFFELLEFLDKRFDLKDVHHVAQNKAYLVRVDFLLFSRFVFELDFMDCARTTSIDPDGLTFNCWSDVLELGS